MAPTKRKVQEEEYAAPCVKRTATAGPAPKVKKSGESPAANTFKAATTLKVGENMEHEVVRKRVKFLESNRSTATLDTMSRPTVIQPDNPQLYFSNVPDYEMLYRIKMESKRVHLENERLRQKLITVEANNDNLIAIWSLELEKTREKHRQDMKKMSARLENMSSQLQQERSKVSALTDSKKTATYKKRNVSENS